MQKAVDAVRRKELSIRKAAELYGVPRATLHDRAFGNVGPCSGPPRHLSIAEEEELVNFLFGCSRIGYPRTRKEVLALVQDRLRRKGYTHTITNGWWQRFRERNAERLSLRTAAPLSKPRAQATDRDTFDRYYELLENTMKENGLLSKPLQIFNCDESGMPLASKLPKVIAKKEEKNPQYVTADTKAQITVMMCVNAAGGWIPPMVIFDRKKLPKAYTVGEVPNTYYGLSPKGWMDSHLFHDWFSNHFLEYCGSQRPVLLLMDGASSHYSPDMIRTAAKEQVILFVLPPHTTHLSQPLDKGVFAAVKTKWREVCHTFLMENPGRVITRYDFSALFCQAFDASLTIRTIKSGFQVTGVYPLNKSVVSFPEDDFQQFEPQTLSSQSGLGYIPLYSNSPFRKPSVMNTTSESNSESDEEEFVSHRVGSSHLPSATPAKPFGMTLHVHVHVYKLIGCCPSA